jgi:hypothetical protein
MTRHPRLLPGALLAAALALVPACTRVENPATGEVQYTTLSPEQ